MGALEGLLVVSLEQAVAAPYCSSRLADAGAIWKDIATKYGLVEPDLSVLASAWHTDADLGRPIEVMTDMSKSRKLGFLEYEPTNESFFRLFEVLRRERLIP